MIRVTCAIILENERVLVTQRSEQMPHPLKWEFPGGKVKDDENPEQCIVREIREELGIEISVKRLLPLVKHHYGPIVIQLIPFVCYPVEGEIVLAEHRSYRWVHSSDLDVMDWLEADVEVVRLFKETI